MLRVRDIMTRDVISLAGEAPLDVAAWRFAFEAVSGAPVRNAKGELIGMLSQRDLTDPLRLGPGVEHIEDIMTPGVWAVHPDMPVLEAVQMMVEKGIHRVLVVSGPDKIAGILSATDVLQALVDGRFVETPEASKNPPREVEDSEEAAESAVGA